LTLPWQQKDLAKPVFEFLTVSEFR